MSLFNENELRSLLQPIVEELVSEQMAKLPIQDISWLNKTHAAQKLDMSRTTFLSVRKEHAIPSSVIDGIERYSTEDLKDFMDQYRS